MGACVCVAMLGPPAAALHRPNAVLRCLCYTPDVKLSGFLPDRRVVQLLRRKSVQDDSACPGPCSTAFRAAAQAGLLVSYSR